MASLFDGTDGKYDISEILRQMEVNCPEPASNSKALWMLRRAPNFQSHNPSSETLLEKSVAILAENGHIPLWFNQCPTASGVVNSNSDKRRNVDLVYWNEADASAHLVELKWGSDTARKAIQQILGYGAAYLYCRKHRDKLPVNDRPIMDASHITLCTLAPARFYDNDSDLANYFKKAQKGLWKLNARPPVAGMTMSIEVLALPESFSTLPFANGAEVKKSCNQVGLTDTGRQVRDAFSGLIPVCA